MLAVKRFSRDQLLKKNIKPVIKQRLSKSKAIEPKPSPKPKPKECKHKNIARDDHIKTCTSCGKVLKEDTIPASTKHQIIIKKLLKIMR